MDNEQPPLSKMANEFHLYTKKETKWYIVDGKHEMKGHLERPELNAHGNILSLGEQSISASSKV